MRNAKSKIQNPKSIILEVAGEVFAEAGFHNATVREICRRAGANVAAVNYHFGDKERLYAEVLHYSQQKAFEKYPPLLDVASDAPAAERLRAFVRSFLLRIFDNSQQFGKIMSREMVEPTGALDSLLMERIRPMANLLRGLVAEILGVSSQKSKVQSPKSKAERQTLDLGQGTLDSETVRLCCFSIVSQCVFFHHCRTMITRLFPEQKLDTSAVEELAGHITRFSLAAMKHLSDSKTVRSGRKPRKRSGLNF